MSFGTATPLVQQTYQSLHFDGSQEHAAAVQEVLAGLIAAGKLFFGDTHGYREGADPPTWRIIVSPADYSPDLQADAGAWIVVSSLGVLRVMTDDDYKTEFADE